MSRSIKVQESVYTRLEEVMFPRETFSQVIERLLHTHDVVSSVKDTLGPRHPVVAGPHRPADPMREAQLDRADLASRALRMED